MKPLEQLPMPLPDPKKQLVVQDDLLGGPSRVYRPTRPRSIRIVSRPLVQSEIPALEVVPEKRGRGRPATRPVGFPASLWKQWCRAVARRGAENTPEGLGRWMAQHNLYRTKLRLRHGWSLEKIQDEPTTRVAWKTVVPRKDLTAAIEAEWRRKISRRREGDPVYRIHLLGIQIRTVVE